MPFSNRVFLTPAGCQCVRQYDLGLEGTVVPVQLGETRTFYLLYLPACASISSISLHPPLSAQDLSFNRLADLPGPSSWASLRKLQFLFLHNNELPEVAPLTALKALLKLRHLTIAGNPLAAQPSYRLEIVQLVSYTMRILVYERHELGSYLYVSSSLLSCPSC